jgi:hypothetical protein
MNISKGERTSYIIVIIAAHGNGNQGKREGIGHRVRPQSVSQQSGGRDLNLTLENMKIK